MNKDQMAAIRDVYRDGLLNDVVPFWIRHAVDRQHGGFMASLDRDGSVVDTDKCLWIQGRFTWLLATLYNRVEPRQEWLDLAYHGADFMQRYGFDDDGKMLFTVTREGRPLRRRRYVHTEGFAAIGLAALGCATRDDTLVDQAYALADQMVRFETTSGMIPAKTNPETRPMKGIGSLMGRIFTAQQLRAAREDPRATRWIDGAIGEIEEDFMHENGWTLETVGPAGQFLDCWEGRMVTPGHVIEAAWFILEESRLRGGDDRLTRMGCRILDWAWDLGWDKEFGGMLYFRDVTGRPVQEYWHDMKFWWPQNETIIACLLAWLLTGETKYSDWHQEIHDWTYKLMPDREHGEWFGYFHRDGRLSSTLKGNLWKGPFHIPRMQLTCWQLVEEKL